MLSGLREKLHQDSNFFQNAALVLDLGPRPFQEAEFRTLRGVFDSAGVSLKGILSDNPITKLMAREDGLELLGSPSIMHSRVRVEHPVKRERLCAPAAPPEPRKEAPKKSGALMMQKTLRSGQKIHHSGDVTILGDVNPGAEVVASGSIVVFGALRGLAHAGAEGNKEAVVAALIFSPTQLRIADSIARAPENAGREAVLPELARIQDGHIVIERFMKEKRD